MEQDEYLVPIRVGMIPNGRLYNSVMRTCPHTRGDDPLAL